MTQTDLDFTDLRENLAVQMAVWWRERPLKWMDTMDQAYIAGLEGARTRRSECKRWYGMTFERERPMQHWPSGKARPRWRYVPAASQTGRAA